MSAFQIRFPSNRIGDASKLARGTEIPHIEIGKLGKKVSVRGHLDFQISILK
jgi:hypothetical protein